MTDQTSELASRWKRLAGALIDVLIGMVLSLPIMMVTGVFSDRMQGQQMTIGQRISYLVLGLACFIIVHGYLLAKHGQTVGKRLVGTRIVRNTDESLLTLGHLILLRYLLIQAITQVPIAGGIFVLLDCLLIFRKDKRCIHDLIAGTKVINVCRLSNQSFDLECESS